MKTTNRILLTLAIFVSAVQAYAIEGLKLSVQCSDVVLHWPSTEGKNYIVQYRPTLDPSTPWQTLTSALPAATGTNVTYFVHSNIVLYPVCDGGSFSMMMSGSSGSEDTLTEEPSVPMAKLADGSGSPAPVSLYPQGFDFSNFLIFDPVSGQWVSGVGFSGFNSSTFSADDLDPITGGGAAGGSPDTSSPPDTGFYQVVQDGVQILDSSIFVLTNAVLSNTVNVAFEAGNAANDGTGINLLGARQCVVTLIDGAKFPGDGGILGSPTNTAWLFALDTAYLNNGSHTLQLAVTWINPDNSDGSHINITRYSDPVSITISNEIYYPNWEPEVGEAGISAYFISTIYTNVGWTLDIFDVNSNLVQTLTNFTADGNIEAYWNMTDTNGIIRTNADVDPEFTSIVTVYDDPVTKKIPKKKQRPKNWPDHGKWVIAYQDFFKFEYSQNNYMQGVLNTYANTTAQYGGYYLYYPQPGQTNDIGQTYPMRYQKVNHPDTNITQITTFLDDQMLRQFLSNTNSRNFFFDGHGYANSLADIDSTLLKATIQHRYRFVMLDACSTATGDLDDAFGIHGPGRFALTYYENTGIRPGAFCGYNADVPYADGAPVTVNGVDYDDTIPNDVPFFISNFLFYWSTYNETLQLAISDAKQNLPHPDGYLGRESHWVIFGYDDLKIDYYNHATDTW
jgi:hypothetical protein